MDHNIGRRQFEIKYRIKDVINSYKDVQEFYWQFIAEGENTIPIRNVTGRIKFPNKVEENENLMAWGHGPLNGEVKLTNRDTVEFNIKDLKPGQMLEMRAITKDRMFLSDSNKEKSNKHLNRVLQEEKKWADEANEERKNAKNIHTVLKVIYAIILLYQIKKFRDIKTIRDKKYIEVQKLEYYRDIPRGKKSTPAEALYMYEFDKERLKTEKIQSRAVASTVLNLCMKKYISLRTEGEKVFVKLEDKELANDLKTNELKIYKLLKEIGKGKTEFEIEEIEKYARTQYKKYSEIIEKFVNETREILYNERLIDKKEENEYASYSNASFKKMFFKNIYEFAVVMCVLMIFPAFNLGLTKIGFVGFEKVMGKILLYLLPYILLKVKLWNLQDGILGNISVLTEEGMKEKEEWKGLKNFMENYSLLNEKKVPDLQLWEEYLVYATAFGISDKVIEQMKATYPEVFVNEYWDDTKKQLYPIIEMASINYDIGVNTFARMDNISNISYTEAVHLVEIHSSGSGSGGGFSGGGGGRRWRRPEWAEDKPSKSY